MNASSSSPADEAAADIVPPDALTMATIEELERAPEQRTWIQSATLLAISLGLFALTGFFNDSPTNIALTIGVLLLHELGHYAGMRLFNYQDVRMFFIPFFGAAVAGRSRSVLGYKEAIVLLLGPLPGIALGLVLGIVCLSVDSPTLRSAALLLLLINAFNLLPFLPLDGGRLMHLVLFSRQPILEAVFRVLTGAVVVWFGWVSGGWFLAAMGVFLIVGTRQTYRVSRLGRQLRGPLHAGTEMDLTARIPREQAIPLVELTRRHFPTAVLPKTLASIVRQVWERIHLRPPGLIASFAFLALSGLAFIVAPLALLVFHAPLTSTQKRLAANGTAIQVREVRVWGRLQESTELDSLGQPDGAHQEFYPHTSQLKVAGAYQKGRLHGTWKEYDESGQLRSEREYRNGELVPEPAAENQ